MLMYLVRGVIEVRQREANVEDDNMEEMDHQAIGVNGSPKDDRNEETTKTSSRIFQNKVNIRKEIKEMTMTVLKRRKRSRIPMMTMTNRMETMMMMRRLLQTMKRTLTRREF